MKAILINTYIGPDNELLPENTEVEITGSFGGCGAYYYNCKIPSGKELSIESSLLKITDYTPWVNWEEIKINAAISIAQGLSANASFAASGEDFLAEKSVRIAERLVERLKKGV